MPVKSDFKNCQHAAEGHPGIDWRECYQCVGEVATQLAVARAYMRELAEGVFNDNGDLVTPVAEPIRGQHFQRIAQTALSVIS